MHMSNRPPISNVLIFTFTRVHKCKICANGPLNTDLKICIVIASAKRGYSLWWWGYYDGWGGIKLKPLNKEQGGRIWSAAIRDTERE